MFESLALIAALLSPASQPASQPAASQPAASQPATPAKMADAKGPLHRGAAFTLAAKDRMTLDAVSDKAPELAGKTVQVTGTVKSACKKKGCWMVLAGDKARARITFKDYGFFVPLDSAGSSAVVEGAVEVKTLSEAERKHLAEDAGKSVDTIPKHELRLIATAVELQPAASK